MANINEPGNNPTKGDAGFDTEDIIDFSGIRRRLGRGLAQILGIGLLGLSIAGVGYLAWGRSATISTSTRVVFSFPGFGSGKYPDDSNFSADDLASPDLIQNAIKQQGLDESSGFQSRIRAALSVEGIIPADVTKNRDRLRAAGQTPPPFVPDEYAVILTLPRNFPLSNDQRALLLDGIINAYREKFERTYADVPLAFGDVFDALHGADYFEYEQILGDEIKNITAYLDTFARPSDDQNVNENEAYSQRVKAAASFRSPTTNLSFSDLLHQTEVFSQLQLNGTLGLIRQNGLSRDRNLALVKMNFYLQTLNDQEQKALEDEKVIQGLLTQAQDRAQSYVLGIKSQAAQPRSEAPVLDQGLIDSLLANDSYNFLVRKALTAGLKLKGIQARKAELLERRKNMESFLQGTHEDQSALIVQVQKSLGALQNSYQELITNIRKTQSDFAHQQFADAIRVSDAIRTEGILRPFAMAGAVGLFLGAVLGMGLSLLGVYIGEKRK